MLRGHVLSLGGGRDARGGARTTAAEHPRADHQRRAAQTRGLGQQRHAKWYLIIKLLDKLIKLLKNLNVMVSLKIVIQVLSI